MLVYTSLFECDCDTSYFAHRPTNQY